MQCLDGDHNGGNGARSLSLALKGLYISLLLPFGQKRLRMATYLLVLVLDVFVAVLRDAAYLIDGEVRDREAARAVPPLIVLDWTNRGI